MMDMNLEELGLRVGLEIHQQLATHKLFCRCRPDSENERILEIKRYLRPSPSELGEVDRAAEEEAARGRYFIYELPSGSACLVEADEEPPHYPNQEALDIAIEIALLLNAEIVDEVHFMRKIVIDGSNTSGFQRTAVIAMDGFLETDWGDIRIPTICLEEEAARIVERTESYSRYDLSRLGIPLVEISTEAMSIPPEGVREVALRIGQILRATRKVRRGIGTIRQDINVSISEGARQEIKGVQELDLIPEVIRNEVLRQLKLLEIRDELKERGVRDLNPEIVDVTKIFENSCSKILRRAISSGGKVLAVKLEGFAGLLGIELIPGKKRRFGTELADYARRRGVGGIFHTDELPGYGITREEVERLRRELGADSLDAIVIVAAEESRARSALEAVVQRARMAILGVPEETRRALPDGTTEYMRPLPGAARMYPETDIPPVPISRERIERIKRSLPELPEEKIKRYLSMGLSQELARQLVGSEYFDVFERIVERRSVDPSIVASTLVGTLKSLSRLGVPVQNLSYDHFDAIFEMLEEGRIAKEALPKLIEECAKKPEEDPRRIVDELGLGTMSEKEVREFVRKVILENLDLVRERGEASFKPLMGKIMKVLRGRADGALISNILKEEIKRALES